MSASKAAIRKPTEAYIADSIKDAPYLPEDIAQSHAGARMAKPARSKPARSKRVR
jgi:hypothetical protein